MFDNRRDGKDRKHYQKTESIETMENIKLNYDDVAIIPEKVTQISSRKECNPYDEDGFLPIFASCMSSVVSMENVSDFNAAKIHAVIPRSYSIEERINYLIKENKFNFVAFSLSEAIDVFLNSLSLSYNLLKDNINKSVTKYRICIDLANGHMAKLLETVKVIKQEWKEHVIIMTGNIANPETYREYEKAGVDYCRVGIGGGGSCLTSSNLGLHYPYFSLIRDIACIKAEINGRCKIIADGNIQGYRDIQKALIFADFVMIGGLFNKAIESAGKTTYGTKYWNIRGKKIVRPISTLLNYGREIPREKFAKAYKLFKEGKLSIWKQFYGQSTKLAQKVVAKANGEDNVKSKTSEGLIRYQKVEYNLKGWAENETDYLRSAMSYTNSRNLEEYKDTDWVRITSIRYNK